MWSGGGEDSVRRVVVFDGYLYRCGVRIILRIFKLWSL